MNSAELPMPGTEPPPRPRAPLRFYRNAPFYFALAFLCAIVGFFPSYFAQLNKTDVAHHFHGILASIWMTMLIVQSWLIRQGHLSQHRRLGKFSLIIAPAFVISGLVMVRVMLLSSDRFSLAYAPRLAFIDLTSIGYFGACYVLALYYRKNIQLHARFMASTAILVLPPAVSRVVGNLVPNISSFAQAFHAAYFICEALVAVLLIAEFRRDTIRPPYLMLMTVLVIQQLSFIALPSIAAWAEFTTWLARL